MNATERLDKFDTLVRITQLLPNSSDGVRRRVFETLDRQLRDFSQIKTDAEFNTAAHVRFVCRKKHMVD